MDKGTLGKLKSLIVLSIFFSPVLFAFEFIDNERAYLATSGKVHAKALMSNRKKNEFSFGDSDLALKAKYFVTDSTFISSGTEAEIKLDEERNEDQFSISQYYLGVGKESFGSLTYGKHTTSSENLNGVDFSQIFGGQSNLNLIGAKRETLKYVYNNELFSLNMTYGLKNNQQDQSLHEFFGQLKLADTTIRGGVGATKTQNNLYQKESIYSHLTAIISSGDIDLGSTYYFNKSEETRNHKDSTYTHAVAIAGRLDWTKELTLFSGYEFVTQIQPQKDKKSKHNLYLGSSYQLNDWSAIQVELNHLDPLVGSNQVNIGIGVAFFL